MVSWLSNKKKIVKYIITSSNQTKKKVQYGFLKFLFVFSHVLLVIKQKKNEIVKYIITSSNQTKKKTTIIFVKIRNRETGKRLRELKVIVSVKAREVKRERERRKNIIYTKNSSYLHWVIRVGSS
jgi:hypothetical protein